VLLHRVSLSWYFGVSGVHFFLILPSPWPSNFVIALVVAAMSTPSISLSRPSGGEKQVSKISSMSTPTLGSSDNERAESSKVELGKLGLQRGSDGLIAWRSDSKDHPRNWSASRKAFDTTVIIFFEFFV